MNRSKSLLQNKNPKFSSALFSLKGLLTWLGLALLRVISLLPYGMLMRLGNATGNLIYKVSPHRKEISKINIERCLHLEGQELDKLVKFNFQAIGRGIFEMAIAWWGSDKKVKKLKTQFINKHLLENPTTGVLVLIKHSTHLELDLRLLSQFFDLSGMYKLQTNEVINYVMIKARNNYIKGSLTNKEAIKAIRWIKSGEIFLYAADQDYGSKVSKMIPFFNHDAATVTFPAFLSGKNIKVVVADISKIENVYEIELQELENQEDEERFLGNMNNLYEKFIRKEPEGYLWMHRRFKSGIGESLYPKWSSREKRREKRRENRG
jgi:KDO2-lipid IV(A) lauroyltransferase